MDRVPNDTPQELLPLASDGVERYVWQIGATRILIEVEGDVVRVNGEVVERFQDPAQPQNGPERTR